VSRGNEVLPSGRADGRATQVNASPALSSDNERDYEMKFNLVEDFYTCIDMEKCFNGQTPKRVGGFDLIYDKDTVGPT